MSEKLRFVIRLGVLTFLLLGLVAARADEAKAPAKPAPGALQFEAYLVWGTTNSVSPNEKHKLVSPEIQKRLGDLPLKWTHYFLCKDVAVEMTKGGDKVVKMSDKLSIRVKDLNGKKTEVVVIDKKGEEILKRTQPLPVNDYFVLAGNAPGANAWFVILKRVK